MVAPLAIWMVRATTRTGRAALAALCLVGIAVQLPAVVVDFSRVGIAAGQPPQAFRTEAWQWAPLRLNTAAAVHAVPANVGHLLGRTPRPATNGEAPASLADRVPYSLDFWWLYLFYLDVLPPWGLVLCAAGPLTGASVLMARAVRHARGSRDGRRP
jgi:hypothetical protein